MIYLIELLTFFFSVLIKILKIPNTKFSENPFGGSGAVPFGQIRPS